MMQLHRARPFCPPDSQARPVGWSVVPVSRVGQRCGGFQQSQLTRASRAITFSVGASTSTSTTAIAAAAVESQRLSDLDLCPFLNIEGFFSPEVPEGTQGTVFAVFDDAKKLQYIGFSKDLRNTLRTVFGRRPDKAFFYKALHFPELDKQAMLDARNAWFEEAGGQPNGNRLKIERVQWELPISSGAVSERGKQQAAEREVERLRVIFKSRGCREEMVADPELLSDGKVDFLPAEALSPEEVRRQEEARAARQNALRNVVAVVDGAQTNFELLVEKSMQTNGGFMFDLKVVHEERETKHRVIVGREYYEDMELQPEQVLDRAFAFLLGKKVARQTEGMLMNGEFPINYFSISTIEQYYDDFAAAFEDTGLQLRDEDKFWRFNRIHTYGYGAAEQPALTA